MGAVLQIFDHVHTPSLHIFLTMLPKLIRSFRLKGGTMSHMKTLLNLWLYVIFLRVPKVPSCVCYTSTFSFLPFFLEKKQWRIDAVLKIFLILLSFKTICWGKVWCFWGILRDPPRTVTFHKWICRWWYIPTIKKNQNIFIYIFFYHAHVLPLLKYIVECIVAMLKAVITQLKIASMHLKWKIKLCKKSSLKMYYCIVSSW